MVQFIRKFLAVSGELLGIFGELFCSSCRTFSQVFGKLWGSFWITFGQFLVIYGAGFGENLDSFWKKNVRLFLVKFGQFLTSGSFGGHLRSF